MTGMHWSIEATQRMVDWHALTPSAFADELIRIEMLQYRNVDHEDRLRLTNAARGLSEVIAIEATARAEWLAREDAEESGQSPAVVEVKLKHIARAIGQVMLYLRVLAERLDEEAMARRAMAG